MSAVARFDRAKNVDGGDIGAGEGAIVHHLFDARADRRDLRGEIGEAARPVADHGRETREPSVGHEAALDHAAEHVRIDVAAAEQKDDALAREFGKLSGKAGGQGCRGRTFDDAFFQFDDAQDRERDLLLVHEHDLVGVLARNLECVVTDLGNGETVGQRRARLDANRFSGAQCSGETGDVIGFDRDDSALAGRNVFTASETPASRPPPPTGTMTASRSGHLRDNLEPGGSLTGDDGGIVVAVDVGEAFLGSRSRGRALWLRRNPCPCSTTVAPSFWQLLILMSGANFGITTVAGTPNNRPW